MANESNADIQRRVIAVLADYTSARVAVPAPEHFLVFDLGMDSLELLAAVTALESEFGCCIPDDIMASVSTVGDLSAWIEARLGAKANA